LTLKYVDVCFFLKKKKKKETIAINSTENKTLETAQMRLKLKIK